MEIGVEIECTFSKNTREASTTVSESLNLDAVINCLEVPQEILGICLTGVTCKLSSEEKADTVRYFLKGLESGMVVVRFAEGVFGVSISPKLMNFCT